MLITPSPPSTLPRAARSSMLHGFRFVPKIFVVHGFLRVCRFFHWKYRFKKSCLNSIWIHRINWSKITQVHYEQNILMNMSEYRFKISHSLWCWEVIRMQYKRQKSLNLFFTFTFLFSIFYLYVKYSKNYFVKLIFLCWF